VNNAGIKFALLSSYFFILESHNI